MVTSELSYGRAGGAGVYAYHLSKELTRQGHHVDLIATVASGWDAKTPFRVYGLKLSKLPIIGMLRWSISAFVYSMKLMRKSRYDIVHVHHPLSKIFPLILSPRIPMVASMHTGWALTNPRQSSLRRIVDFLLDLFVCKKCRRVIVLNRHTEFQLLRWGISRETIKYVPNGIDRSEFIGKRNKPSSLRRKLGIPEDAVVLLYVGRLDRGKGVENLLKAFHIVQEHTQKSVWAIIVGEGELRRDLMRASRDLHNTVFMGFIPRNELLAAYAESDVFVMPSEGGEGMPTVVLEAMAAGLPVIATRIPGNIDIAVTEFGKLVPPGDAQQLALSLLDMIRNPASLKQLGSRASLFSKRYDWSNIASRIVEVFESCQQR
jgi:phosphatidylinositol alpha-mannosyltransferase